MRKPVIAAGIAFLLLNLAADPPPIIWQSDEKRPEVIDGRENIVIVRDASESASAAFPPDSAAGRIVQKGYILTWTPKWYFHGTGGVRLPDSAVSGDRSVMAVLETAGGERGPWQSRIVCISPKNGQVLRIVELKERNIERIRFLPGAAEVLLYQAGQSVFGQANRLLKADLASGGVTAEYPPLPGELQALCVSPDGAKAAVKLKNSTSILIYELAAPDRAPLVIDSGFEGGALGFTADKESVAAAGDGGIYFFSLLNPGTQSRDPVRFPGGFVPDFLEIAGDGTDEMIVGKTDGNPFHLLRGGRNFLLDDSGEGFACFAGNTIMLVTQGQSAARFLDRSTLAETARVQVRSDRPPTRGSLINLFYDPANGLLAVDSHGNIYTRQAGAGRKWNKKLLFAARQ